MAGLERIDRKKIEYQGHFDFSDLYRLLEDLIGTDYNYSITETDYVKDIGAGEIEVRWECKKKISGFLRYRIDMVLYITDLEREEVEKGGKRRKLEKGNLELYLTAYLETDYLNRWEANAFLKFLKGIYKRYLYRRTYEHHMDKIRKELWSIADEVKGFFQISPGR